MNKKDLIFISIAIGVIGLFIFLSLIGQKPKPLTASDYHSSVTPQTTREDCLACHHPDHPATEKARMPANHPQKGRWDDRKATGCLVCHKPPVAQTAIIFSTKPREGQFSWLNRQQR